MDVFQHQKNLEKSLNNIRLPSGCNLRQPEWESTNPPHFWTVEFFIDFSDGKHIRIWESYSKISGLQMSRKLQWAYHYGETANFSEGGQAGRGNPDDPVDLRIDTCGGLHMHYKSREPHYKQSEIKGLNLSEYGALDFIKDVLKHRKTSKPLNMVIGFEVEGNVNEQ